MVKRIEYIDALRGFTMILVVMRHVYVFGYKNYYFSINSYNEFFVLFRMPLFFFISGFILYGTSRKWQTIKDGISFIKKKSKVQLIPTAVFSAAFVFLSGNGIRALLYDTSKMGYWFTIALFIFFCLYFLHHVIAEKLLHMSDKTQNILLLGFALLCYVFCRHFAYDLLGAKLYGLTSIANIQYYIFFIFGFFMKKYFSDVEKLFDGRYSSALLISLFLLIVLPYKKFTEGIEDAYITDFLRLIVGCLGILVLLSFFRKYETSFTKDKKLGNALQYVGRRTLDIYLLHYFFIPRNLIFVGKFFNDFENPIVEFALTFVLAMIVVAVSLVVSNVIRISPFLAHNLFGAKYDQTQI